MSIPGSLAKAKLLQLDAKFQNVIQGERAATFQFNPETLKVSFSNQIKTPAGAASQQFVGSGTTKLSLTMVFDATVADLSLGVVDDVRRLTQKVAYFITPQPEGDKFVPPAVRFLWGSFQFDGIVDSLEENLEFFSSDGKPLRATMALSMSQQRIKEFTFAGGGGSGVGGGIPPVPGTQPLAEAPAGASLQSLAAQAGVGDRWQDIAAANGIENPRQLSPGQLINLAPR